MTDVLGFKVEHAKAASQHLRECRDRLLTAA